MPRRPLGSILLLLAMTVGCTDQTTNDPPKPGDQVLAQERSGGGDGEPSAAVAPEGAAPAEGAADEGTSPNVEIVPTEGGFTLKGKPSTFMGGLRRQVQDMHPEEVERQFERLGPVSLELSDLPATADPLEPGRYLLSIVIQLSSGSFNKNQWPCRVEVEGPDVRILLENTSTDPILATLHDGEFFSEPREGRGTYGLEGQMVGPGKLRGVVVPGPEDHPMVGIVRGRWGLDKLPLPDGTDK